MRMSFFIVAAVGPSGRCPKDCIVEGLVPGMTSVPLLWSFVVLRMRVETPARIVSFKVKWCRTSDPSSDKGVSGDFFKRAASETKVRGRGILTEGKLSSFSGTNGGEKARSGNFGRVGSKNAVDFLPYLKLFGIQADSNQAGTKIGVAATYSTFKEATVNLPKVARNDRNTLTAGFNLGGEHGGKVCIE